MILVRFAILCLVSTWLLLSCSPSNKTDDLVENKIVAKVNENILYSKDIQDIAPSNSSPKDSAEILERYINNWVRKQLLFSQAQEQLSLNNPEIERKVEDYKYSLYIYELKKKLLLTRLDSVVNENEILDYYQKYAADFLLQSTILKGVLIKAPLNSIAEKTLKNQLSIPVLPLLEIIQVCSDNQFILVNSLDQWLQFDGFLADTPFDLIRNKQEWKNGIPYLTARDKEFIYLLKIVDLKRPMEPAPIDFVKGNIKAIIINRRKLAIVNELEDQLFNEAMKKNKVEINYKPYSASPK